MNKRAIFFWSVFLLILIPFFVSDKAYEAYLWASTTHPYIASFFKFAILATAGDIMGVRLKTGEYIPRGFGLLPKMIVWGLLGITIAIAMKIFAQGAPLILESLGFEGVANAMKSPFSLNKLLGAFSISLAMNLIFAPVMMTVHKVTDTHIESREGALNSLISRVHVGKILGNMDWDRQWNFVFKKTITLFWIPAHTITFCLPSHFQVLFAACLGIALGLILSIAAKK